MAWEGLAVDAGLDEDVWLAVGAMLELWDPDTACVPLDVCEGLVVSACEGDAPKLRVWDGVKAWLGDCEDVRLAVGD